MNNSLKNPNDYFFKWTTKDQKFRTNKNYATNLAKERFEYLNGKFQLYWTNIIEMRSICFCDPLRLAVRKKPEAYTVNIHSVEMFNTYVIK